MASTSTTIFAAASRAAVSTDHPQTTPLPGQVKNSADGYSHLVTDKDAIRRLLVFGTNSPTYYANASTLSAKGAAFCIKMIEEGKGQDILNILVSVHNSGAAPKMTTTFSILGMLTRCIDDKVRSSALAYIGSKGLRTLSQVYMWWKCHTASGDGKGAGRGVRRALTNLIGPNSYPSSKSLAYQIVKYAQREGVSIKDILAMVHPPTSKMTKKGGTTNRIDWPLGHQIVITYAVSNFKKATKGAGFSVVLERYCKCDIPMDSLMAMPDEEFHGYITSLPADFDDDAKEVLHYLWAIEKVKIGDDVDETCSIISKFNLPREIIPTPLLNEKKVWFSLLIGDTRDSDIKIKMPITALIRNLGKMAWLGMFNTSLGDASYKSFTESIVKAVCDHITNERVIRNGRVHPATLVQAYKTYSSGSGDKGSLMWSPNPNISKALNDAVDIAFYTIKPSPGVHLHALDISGSMNCCFSAVPSLTAFEASVIQMLCHLKTNLRNGGGRQIVMVFDVKGSVVFDSDPDSTAYTMDTIVSNTRYQDYGRGKPLPKGPLFDPLADSWDTVIRKLQGLPMGGTDCAQPVLLAKKMVTSSIARPEIFSVYTDNETYYGSIHPSVALKNYRKTVPNAKMIVIAATPTRFTIADPNDPNSLDICGWDTGAGTVIHDFISGDTAAGNDHADGGGGR